MVQLRSSVRRGTHGEPHHSIGTRRSAPRTRLQRRSQTTLPSKVAETLSFRRGYSEDSLDDGDVVVVAQSTTPHRKFEKPVSGTEATDSTFNSDMDTNNGRWIPVDTVAPVTSLFLMPPMNSTYNTPLQTSWQQAPDEALTEDYSQLLNTYGTNMAPGNYASFVDTSSDQINTLTPSDLLNIDPPANIMPLNLSKTTAFKTLPDHDLQVSRARRSGYTGMVQMDTADQQSNFKGQENQAHVGYSSAWRFPQGPLTSDSTSNHDAKTVARRINYSSRRLSPAELKWIGKHASFSSVKAARVVKHIFGISQPRCLLNAIRCGVPIFMITQKMLDEFEGEFCHAKWTFEEMREALTAQRFENLMTRGGRFSLWSIPVEVAGFTRQCDCAGC